MDDLKQVKKNPSRENCEQAIRRILMTEMLEKGKNENFKNATDFMPYFESLYPASPSLTKQVQRAIRSMDLPKDERGYFIINKTKKQIDEDKAITEILRLSNASLVNLSEMKPVFIKCHESFSETLMQLISTSDTFKDRFEVMLPAHGGILVYTKKPEIFSTEFGKLL